MSYCILSDRPDNAIHLQYFAQTRGIQFDDIIICGGNQTYDTLHLYAEKNSFNVHYVPEPNKASPKIEHIQPEILAIITSSILKKQIINLPTVGTVNSHGAVLPKYRGYGSSHWAILYGDDIGASAHIVDQGVDTGPILATRLLNPSEFASIEEIIAGIYYQCKYQVMVDAIQKLSDENAEPSIQTKRGGKQYFEMHPRILEITRRVFAMKHT